MRHSEEDFQRDIDLVIIPKEADGRIPRATQKIPAKLYVDVGPVLEDDIGIVIITRARDIVEVPQSHLEIIGKQFLGDRPVELIGELWKGKNCRIIVLDHTLRKLEVRVQIARAVVIYTEDILENRAVNSA